MKNEIKNGNEKLALGLIYIIMKLQRAKPQHENIQTKITKVCSWIKTEVYFSCRNLFAKQFGIHYEVRGAFEAILSSCRHFDLVDDMSVAMNHFGFFLKLIAPHKHCLETTQKIAIEQLWVWAIHAHDDALCQLQDFLRKNKCQKMMRGRSFQFAKMFVVASFHISIVVSQILFLRKVLTFWPEREGRREHSN